MFEAFFNDLLIVIFTITCYCNTTQLTKYYIKLSFYNVAHFYITIVLTYVTTFMDAYNAVRPKTPNAMHLQSCITSSDVSRLYLLSLNTADPECLLCPEEEEEEEVVEEEEVEEEEEEEFVDEMTEEVEGSCAYANTVCMSK